MNLCRCKLKLNTHVHCPLCTKPMREDSVGKHIETVHNIYIMGKLSWKDVDLKTTA